MIAMTNNIMILEISMETCQTETVPIPFSSNYILSTMEFDLDDPLDDILKSDNSTDSFFGGNNVKPVGKPVKSATETKSHDKARMSDLFGIKAPEPEVPRPQSQPPPPSVRPVTAQKNPEPPKNSAPEKPLQKKGVSFDADDDDSLTDLGFDPKKAKAKTNLFNDLLAPSVKSEPKSNPPPQRPKTAIFPENKSIIEERPKTAIRSSPKKSIKDPLGLFATEKVSLVKQNSKDEGKSATFDWLEPKKEEPISASQPETHSQQQQMTQINTQAPSAVNQATSSASMTIPLSTEAVLLDALQRQESQLTIATQMRQQETVLFDMQQRQKALLQQQEAKFQELMQNQINRQVHLEGTIRNQQNRINNHLNNLMNQPLDVPVTLKGDESANSVTSSKQDQPQNRDIELIELHNEVKTLELEKLRFEDLFSNATAIHEQEVAFIDQSHKKQIQLLEDQVRQVEDRLRQENKALEEFYKNKLDLSESDKRQMIEKYEQKLTDLKEDHQKAISHLKESKLMELSQMQDSFSYLDHLKTAAKYMETATGDIESLRVTINERIETIHKDKERDLERREKRVEAEQKHLTLVKETAQAEQKRLLELVHSLENKLSSLSKETSEDQWIVRQKLAALEAERSAFEREQFYFREQQKRDEQRITELKESALHQQTAMMEELNREKVRLAEEKVKFVTLQRLNKAKGPAASAQSNQHEVEIAINVAKEAARQSDVERDNWMTRQRQCEVKKREIVEYEQQIRRKETELEVMLNAVRERDQKAENFIRNAKMMEQKVIIKYQELTRNAHDLVERERKLSEEKQSLSRERMELQALKQQGSNDGRCGLCKTTGGLTGISAERDQVENFNYNDLNVGLVSGVDLMFSQELNAILKQVPQMDNSFNDRSGLDKTFY